MDTPRVPKATWNPREQLAELMLESQFDNHDAAAATSRVLREHALVAAQSIAHLAAYAGNERVRFQAASYIVDRVLGGGLDADIKLLQEQQRLTGQALFAAIKALGQRYDFSLDDPEVRKIAHRTLIEVSEKTA